MTKKKRDEMSALLIGKGVNTVFKKLCGEKLGEGSYRDVYVFKQFPEYVIKIERDMAGGNFANAMEWRNYINNKDWNLVSEWLAPCELINATGNVLVQQRISLNGKRRKDYPKYVPIIFTDLKLKNFGWIGDKFVCCDYSYFPVAITAVGKKPMKYAKWWGTLK